MDTVKIKDRGKTRFIAHRGLSGIERENTLSAFVAAGNHSYFGAECDIHPTTDKRYVIFHNDTTGGLCERDLIISESSSKELRALKMKGSGTEEYSDTHKIPYFEEYLDVMKRYGKVAVTEFKEKMPKDEIARVLGICKERYSLDKVIFISFIFDNLVRLKELKSDQSAQYLTGEVSDKIIADLVKYGIDIDADYHALTPENIVKMHGLGIKVNCYTCDDIDDAQMLINWGADYITTDILE